MSKSKYQIPNYKPVITNLKFKFGDDVNFSPSSIDTTPTFAYDYISLEQSKYCFDNPDLMCRDLMGYFFATKQISLKKVSTLFEEKKDHFHIIDLLEKNFLVPMIRKQLGIDKMVSVDDLPIVAQFAVETDPDRESPRVVFFLGRYGTFHVLFFDRQHAIYPKTQS